MGTRGSRWVVSREGYEGREDFTTKPTKTHEEEKTSLDLFSSCVSVVFVASWYNLRDLRTLHSLDAEDVGVVAFGFAASRSFHAGGFTPSRCCTK